MSAVPRPALRTLLRVAGAIGVLIAILLARVLSASSAELEAAESLRARGDVEASIAHYRRAARWYAPGNPFCTTALARLGAIARDAEDEGDVQLALAAWRSVRSAIMSARSTYVPHQQALAEADEHIAELMASETAPAIDADRSREELRAAHLELLQRDLDPALGWTIIALLGLAAWIGGAFAFVTRGIDAEDRVVGREARIWATLFVAGIGLFALGLAMA